MPIAQTGEEILVYEHYQNKTPRTKPYRQTAPRPYIHIHADTSHHSNDEDRARWLPVRPIVEQGD